MAAFTSKASGNWATSGQTTWNQVGVPGTGDTAAVNHDVTITADTVIGIGTATTALTVGTGGTGSLTITGAKLTIKGNSTIGAGSGGTLKTPLVVQNSGGTSGGIIFYGNAAVTPTMSVDDDTKLTFTGTSSARSYLRSSSIAKGDSADNAGNNAILTTLGGNRCFYMVCAYVDFYKLGDSGTVGIYAHNVNTFGAGAGTWAFTWDNCLIDTCGTCPEVDISEVAPILNFSLTASTWQNTLATYALIFSAGQRAIGSGTRLISGCIFLNSISLSDGTALTLTNNYFDTLFTYNRTYLWASGDGNFFNNPLAGSPSNAPGMGGDTTNNFFLANPSNPADYGNFFITPYNTSSLSNNVFQYTGTNTGNTYIMRFSDSPNASVWTITKNVVLPAPGSPNGAAGIVLVDAINATGNAICSGIIEHNTVCVGVGYGVGIERTEARINTLTSLKANIFWRTGAAASGEYVIKNVSSPASGATLNCMPATAATNNAWLGLDVVSGNPFSGVSGDTNIENATVYYSPMSGSTAPGANDKTNVNPGFVDATRTLQTWDASLGGAGTIAAALARIQANTTLTKTSLLPYIWAGFVPTNTVLQTASYGGDASTTDAAGNPWTGGTPGIGALSLAPPLPQQVAPPKPLNLTAKPIAAGWV